MKYLNKSESILEDCLSFNCPLYLAVCVSIMAASTALMLKKQL